VDELTTKLLLDPSREYGVAELAKVVGRAEEVILREVDRLVSLGVLKERYQGQDRYVSANPDQWLSAHRLAFGSTPRWR
jgi:predicted transcriptional regulator